MCSRTQPHLRSLSTPPTALKGFKFRRCSITSSFFKSEIANERPCKSFVEFVLAKDYREIPFQSLAGAHELSIDAGKGSQAIQIALCNFFFPPMGCSFKWTALLHSDKGKWFKSHLFCVVSIQKESNLIYCSSNGWNTTLLNVIKTLISAPSPNKSIGNMVVTYP